MTMSYPLHLPVWSDPERLGGKPCFKGTRVPVEALFLNLGDNLSLAEFLDCFPEVSREQAVAVLTFANHQLFVHAA